MFFVYSFIYFFSTLILYKRKTEFTVLPGFQLFFGPEINLTVTLVSILLKR